MTKVSTALALMALSGASMAGISSTKHNLGGSFNGGGANGATLGFNFTTSTTEICVFCHTPHGSDSSAPAPLWNRTLGTSANYQTYSSLGTTTMDASSAGIGSVSLACLSCHDGTQAMNAVINSPGGGSTGDVNKSGSVTFISTLSAVDCTSTDGSCGGFFEFNYMSQVAGEMIYLATDLRNDHPISIQYAGAIVGGAQARAALDTDFKDASVATAAGVNVWYIDTDGVAAKSKYDLPLYNRPTGTLAGEPLVECATCHDPHTKNTTFLRHANGNNGSATCLSCHTK